MHASGDQEQYGLQQNSDNVQNGLEDADRAASRV